MWGKLQQEPGRRSLGGDRGPVWYVPSPHQHKGRPVRLALQPVGAGARPRHGHRVRSGSGGGRSARRGPRTPVSVQQRRGGWGATSGLPPASAGPGGSGRGERALHLGPSRAGCGLRLGGVLSPRSAAHTLTSSSSSASANSKVFACTVLGTGGPRARLGCTPLFIQALPRGPALGQHLHQLPPSIHLRVVAAAPAAAPAGSPGPAGGRVSRRTGTPSLGGGPRLGHGARPSSYPIGAASTGWGA